MSYNFCFISSIAGVIFCLIESTFGFVINAFWSSLNSFGTKSGGNFLLPRCFPRLTTSLLKSEYFIKSDVL